MGVTLPIVLLSGCGALFGPPVTCTVELLRPDAYYAYDLMARDLVCHADEDLDDYWVIIEYEGDWGPQSYTYGHHEVKKGSLDHHEEARVGARVTIEADGYWPKRFTIPFR